MRSKEIAQAMHTVFHSVTRGDGITCLLMVVGSMCMHHLSAQNGYNANIFPLGDKEALMANTGTGGLGSSGAAYYNPAALTQLDGTSFSLSGSAYLQYRFKASPIFRTGTTELDFEGKGFETVPSSMVMARSLGKWVLAFSILVPSQFEYEGQQDWTLPIDGVPYQMKFLQNYSEVLYQGGISAARKVGGGWSVGLSLYGQYFSYLSFADLRLSHPTDPSLVSFSTRREKRSPYGAMAIAGLHWQGENLAVGLRVATPDIHVGGKGEFYSYTYNGSVPDTVIIDLEDLRELSTNYGSPLDIRAGMVYDLQNDIRFAFDASYGLGREYRPYDDPRFDQVERLESTYRLSLGVEAPISEKRSIMTGASYSPITSASNGVSSTIDYIMVTLGFKLKLGVTESTIGFFRAMGEGELPLAVGVGDGVQTYTYTGAFLATSVIL